MSGRSKRMYCTAADVVHAIGRSQTPCNSFRVHVPITVMGGVLTRFVIQIQTRPAASVLTALCHSIAHS